MTAGIRTHARTTCSGAGCAYDGARLLPDLLQEKNHLFDIRSPIHGKAMD